MTAHRIHAIRYARHERVAADNFIDGPHPPDDHAAPMPLDYYVWLIERERAGPILVDTGFGADAAARRKRTIIRPVEQGLAAIGIDPAAIEDVVLTHLHYDHAGSLGLFPRARFHVQESELAFATGRNMLHRHVRAPFDAEPVADMVRLLFGERLVFHDGDAPLVPGVMLRSLYGHTAGLMGVEILTARGPVILASDACHLYANLVREMPFPIVVDVPGYLDAHRRLKALAPGLDHIIPGHDPLVLAAFPEGAAPDVARVDLPPHTAIEALLCGAVGFIGLGRMGAGMAGRLRAAGVPVVVHDVSDEAVAAMVAQGAQAAASPKAVADAAEIVCVSLPMPDIVHEVLLGPDGVADGKAVRIAVDLSTSGAAMAKRISEGLAANGIASFDAPVSGGVKPAREGKLSLMASGPEAHWPAVEAVLGHFGKSFYMGPTPGAGQTMKLVNNLLGAIAIAVTAEGMTMGIKAGLDPARMIEVLNQSTGINSATRDKWPRAVLPRTFDFGFAAALSHKDMKLMVAEAEALGMEPHLGIYVRDLLARVLSEVGPEADFTAMAKVVEADAGLDPERGA